MYLCVVWLSPPLPPAVGVGVGVLVKEVCDVVSD